ncbi:MAG: hypothetical protein ACFFDF_13060 [Candidatus Odinarchaeota archaeon]
MRKNNNDKEIIDLELNYKIKFIIIANILDSLREILLVLNPLIKKILAMEEAEMYHRNGTLKKGEKLFENISNQSKKLMNSSIPSEILDNLNDSFL